MLYAFWQKNDDRLKTGFGAVYEAVLIDSHMGTDTKAFDLTFIILFKIFLFIYHKASI